jgi:hypothetical protein
MLGELLVAVLCQRTGRQNFLYTLLKTDTVIAKGKLNGVHLQSG